MAITSRRPGDALAFWQQIFDARVSDRIEDRVSGMTLDITFLRLNPRHHSVAIAATRGGKGQTAYSASKAALEACITTLAKECVRKRIRFNAVRPGLVDTEMTRSWLRRAKLTGDFDPDRAQLSGMADPADIAALIAFLVSDDSRHIVGSHIPIDGGGPLSTLD